MAENLQDLQEVMKDEVPNLRELTLNRICDLLDKETESDKILARDLAREVPNSLKTPKSVVNKDFKVVMSWATPRDRMHIRNKAKNKACSVGYVRRWIYEDGISKPVRSVCGWCKLDAFFKDNVIPKVLETAIRDRLQELHVPGPFRCRKMYVVN